MGRYYYPTSFFYYYSIYPKDVLCLYKYFFIIGYRYRRPYDLRLFFDSAIGFLEEVDGKYYLELLLNPIYFEAIRELFPPYSIE